MTNLTDASIGRQYIITVQRHSNTTVGLPVLEPGEVKGSFQGQIELEVCYSLYSIIADRSGSLCDETHHVVICGNQWPDSTQLFHQMRPSPCSFDPIWLKVTELSSRDSSFIKGETLLVLGVGDCHLKAEEYSYLKVHISTPVYCPRTNIS